MKSIRSSPKGAAAEISALIEVLHRTGQRLEELTAGEVDTVADVSGQTFLLRGAQETGRFREASRQAAVLNALPALVALVDTQGIIVSVNEAWRDFPRVRMRGTLHRGQLSIDLRRRSGRWLDLRSPRRPRHPFRALGRGASFLVGVPLPYGRFHSGGSCCA
ncbi:MAG: hypothetical protein WDO56_20005 [Gammaproteobacteria bacterium]